MPSPLYASIMDWNRQQGDNERTELAHQVWDGTPWIVDAYVGRDSKDDRRDRDIRLWCHDRFGKESWPFSDVKRPGAWHFGGATINGWTWIGFDSEAKMLEFLAVWPAPEGVPGPNE